MKRVITLVDECTPLACALASGTLRRIMAKVSVDECRRILGSEAESMSDADIEKLLSSLGRTADALYTQMTDHLRSGVASVEEWRAVLGLASNGLSDTDIESAQIDYAAERVPEREKRNAVERVRWIAHAQNTGQHE